MGINHVHRGLALAAPLIVLAALPACSGKAAPPSPQSKASQTSAVGSGAASATASQSAGAAAATARWTELKPGQCLAAPPPTDPAVVIVDIVDCAKPHSAEVFLRVSIPVDAALTGTANAQCESGLAQYTGNASAAGQYTITYLIDSDQDRTFNNPLPSTLICLIQGIQGQPLTGSARS
jgi:hypothetical protein